MACKTTTKAVAYVRNPNIPALVNPSLEKKLLILRQRVTVLGSIIDRWSPFMEIVERNVNRMKSEVPNFSVKTSADLDVELDDEEDKDKDKDKDERVYGISGGPLPIEKTFKE